MNFCIKSLFVLLLSIEFFPCPSSCRFVKKSPKNQSSNEKKPALAINPEKLPPLEDVLAEVNMSHRLKDFIRIGVSETRFLLRLQRMDFQMMVCSNKLLLDVCHFLQILDWEDMKESDVEILKAKIAKLVELATEEVVVVSPEVGERSKLTYGRVYVSDFVQSLEVLI